MRKTTALWKFLVLFAVLVSSAACLSGCAGGNTDSAQLSVSVKIAADEELLSKTVSVDEGATADKAIISACQEKKLAYTFVEGMFDNFGTVASTLTDGWLLYINGEIAEVGAAQIELHDGDTLEFLYQNYDEAFSLE